LALGDVDGDSFTDIITGTASLADHVKVFKNLTTSTGATPTPTPTPTGTLPFGGFNSDSILASFLAYGGFPNGIYVSSQNLVQDTTSTSSMTGFTSTTSSPGDEIIVGPATGPSHLKVFMSQGTRTQD